MSRLVLVMPGSTYRAPDFLRAAGRLRTEVVVASDASQTMADGEPGRFLTVDLDDPERAADQIVRHAERHPLEAVVAVDDHGVVVAARAACLLDLPHNPVEAVAATRSKAALRSALVGSGVPQPEHRIVDEGPDALAGAEEVGFPCVVKATSLQGGRGVLRVDRPAELPGAVERVRSVLRDAGRPPEEPLVVERYLPGPEVALEGLLREGALEVLAVFDKPDPMEGPTFEETLLITPSRLPAPLLDRLEEVTARAVDALGLREGPVHAELRIPDGEPHLLEVAARSIGGLCSRSLTFGLLGISLEEVILRHALGRPLPTLQRRAAASGVLMLPIPRAGVLREVRGRETAREVPGVTGIEITISPGSRVRPLPEGDRYLGFVFAEGADPPGVETALRDAWAHLEVEVEPG